MSMLRNAIGSVVALAGAMAAVRSPFRAWYAGRHGSDYRTEDLFRSAGVTGVHAGVLGSLFAPMLLAALVTLVGILRCSRLLVATAGTLVLGVTVLWAVRQGQAARSLTVGADGHGLNAGAGAAFAAGALLLIAAAIMSGRARPQPSRYPPSERLRHRTHRTSRTVRKSRWRRTHRKSRTRRRARTQRKSRTRPPSRMRRRIPTLPMSRTGPRPRSRTGRRPHAPQGPYESPGPGAPYETHDPYAPGPTGPQPWPPSPDGPPEEPPRPPHDPR
ncbi:hypothetical protein ACFQ2B_12855 [Streptomyces stramineus]